ncbi:MAG: S9 family peptidase [Oceanicaulis sp.]|uniref:prolyl oligopeptidase family serine peptidase n=1 Tax=Glycocaulis sp. TaxID=1969725 RepID=UPI0025BB91B4|nr:prolyl oligopeptidase family serine peptidase [Glycocaulis sp.]MCC5981173.1 S9 family peptidase [Oceanicaulis sp.]MCH8520375.1 prolyl oligopeptidase family serine peptidase [Glycocaulis sp.]
MIKRSLVLSLASVVALAACGEQVPNGEGDASAVVAGAAHTQQRLIYPTTLRVDQVDTYQSASRGEVEVEDPYRWLEADVRVSPEVEAWVAAQNAVTGRYLEGLPGRAMIAERLRELWNYERRSVPAAREGLYFFSHNDGLQDQSIYKVQEGLEGEPRVLIDPNTLSEDGTVALAGTWPSPDGSHVAYFLQDGGSDWRTAHVINVETGAQLEDRLEWVKFSNLSWAKDGSGFFYSRYPQPEAGEEFTSLNHDQAIYFHALGTGQSEDRLIMSDPENPEVSWRAGVSDDGDYLFIYSSAGTDGNAIHILDLTQEGAEPVAIFEGFENNHSPVGNDGETFFFMTDLDAPNQRIVAVNLSDPSTLTDIIPQGDFPISAASHVGGHLIVRTFEDVRSVVRIYTLEGEEVREVELPGLGVAGGFNGRPDNPETFYSFTSFNRPATIYRYDVETGESTLFHEAPLTFDPDDYEVSQVFYESTGGVQVPMYVVHHRDVTPNGERPVLLYGYGGFNIPMTPGFSVPRLQWMEMGGVFALANIRGGSEYGRDWHDGGRLASKQNVYDDFINAAEHLIEMGWTSPANIAIEGRSNGGLLVGAVANQRPDLFAAALPGVGVMDMLRFNQFTAGRFWVSDYGSPQDPEMFDVLYAYSPLHNVPEGQGYPATLVTTADTDDRVVPSHSFKYIAEVQATETGDAPTLIRIETRAGHGAGTPVSMLIQETADKWAFIAFHTGLDLTQPQNRQ